MSMKLPTIHDSCLEAALAYAQFGWRVLPVHSLQLGRCTCRKPGCNKVAKHPCIKNWTALATTDEAQIHSWFEEFPWANVGIATGCESGIFVVDVDRKPDLDGDATLKALEEESGALPDTLEVSTGSGGTHRYFQAPDGVVPTRGGVRPGIDIRAQGGMVLAPPSMHRTGNRYSFTNEIEPAQPTHWLLDAVRKHATRKPDEKRTEEVMQKRDTLIPKGQRNTVLTSLAGKLRWNGLEAREIEALLLMINEVNCVTPLDESEVAEIAQSVAKYPTGRERKATWWYPNDVDSYQGQQVKLLTDYQRGWYRTLRDAAWRYGGSLPATPEELASLAEPTNRPQFLEECVSVMELFRRIEASFGNVLVDEPLVRLYLESTALASIKSKAGRASGGNRREERMEGGQ